MSKNYPQEINELVNKAQRQGARESSVSRETLDQASRYKYQILKIKEEYNIADNDPVFALIQANAAHVKSIAHVMIGLDRLMAEADNRMNATEKVETLLLKNECERLEREIAERQSFIQEAKQETREVFETFRSHQERFAYQITQIQKTHEAQEEQQRKRFKSFEDTITKAENFSWVLAGLLGTSVIVHVFGIALIIKTL